MTLYQAVSKARLFAARGQRPFLVDLADPLRVIGSQWGDEGPLAANLSDALEEGRNLLAVYPSSLVKPVADVLWVWWVAPEDRYRLGTANQAAEYARRRRIEQEDVFAVPADRVHGCQVREDLPGNRYRFLQPASFPAWCGV